jgi:AcrR family transcriptional regulator
MGNAKYHRLETFLEANRLADTSDRQSGARTRDREGTERAILDAARTLIAREGYAAFGVNAVAREAGCDKQLIYRYFGGTDGLIAAIGEASAGWIETALAPVRLPPGRPYGEVVLACVEALLDALRVDPLMRQLIGWELTGTGEAVQGMARARAAALGARVLPLLKSAAPPPAGVDAPVLNALLIGAVQQAAMSGTAHGGFVGMPLQTDADWTRLKAGLRALVNGVYGSGERA